MASKGWRVTRHIGVAAALLLSAGMAPAQEVTLTDDAHTSRLRPTRNFGPQASLEVGGRIGGRAFLKFKLTSTLPSNTTGGHVGRATLSVFIGQVNAPGAIDVVAITPPMPSWSEATLTDANAPPLDPSFAPPAAVTPGQAGKWITIDVTPLVQATLDRGFTVQGLALVAAGPGGFSIDSKENTDTSHEPRLEIVLSHAATADRASVAESATTAQTAINATQLGGAPAASYVLQGDPALTAPRPPAPGSASYIQNSIVQQPNASFNIGGDGTLFGTLSAGRVGIGTRDPGFRFHLMDSGITEARIQSRDERAILSLDSTIGGQNRIWTVENGVSGTPGLFGISDRTALESRLSIDPFGTVTVGPPTPQEPDPDAWVKFRVRGRLTNATFGLGVTEAKIQSDDERAILSLDSTIANQRKVWTLENGVFGIPGLFAIFDRSQFQARLTIDTAGKVSVPGNLDVGQTLSANTLSLNVVEATSRYDLGGQPVIRQQGMNLALGSGAGLAAGSALDESTAVGVNAGKAGGGAFNVFVGTNAGLNNAQGGFEVFLGAHAGFSNTTGFGNTFVGAFSGGSNTSGDLNSFFGNLSGNSNTTGAHNSFFGTGAGRSNTIGKNNAYFGAQAGYANQGGFWNAFFGAYAGENTTSSLNTFVGGEAGRANTSGEMNTFIGGAAGLSNTTGGANTFVGYLAGLESTDSGLNTFVGTQAGHKSKGSHNSFFGALAGSQNGGNFNSFVGQLAGAANTADFNAFVGAGAGELNTTGTDNTFMGTSTGGANVTGSENTFVGRSVGLANVSGSGNTLVGAGANVASDQLANATAIGAKALVSTDNALVLGGIKGVNGAAADTFVGIGTDSPAAPLDVKGANADGNAAVRIQSPAGTALLSLESAVGGAAHVWNLESGAFHVPGLFSIFDRSAFESRLAIDLAGNVGIGTTTPGSRLTVAGLIEATAPGGGVKFPDGTIQVTAARTGPVQAADIGAGQVVKTLNGLTDAVTIAAGPNVTITPAGNTLTIAATGGGGGGGILNQSTLQTSANFNVDGSGSAAVLNAATEYKLGGTRLLSAPGAGNLFAGFGAGQSNTPGVPLPQFGTQNAFFGVNAGASNNIGWQNAYFGVGAGEKNGVGQGNAFFGFQAGQTDQGGANAYFGFRAGGAHVNGSRNSFFGHQAGQASQGSANSFFGASAGAHNQAEGNAFFGADAGRENTTGSANSYFGGAAGRENTDGTDNTFVGSAAGAYSVGSGNTFVGSRARADSPYAPSQASYNTAIGYNATTLYTAINATAIGANAQAAQSNSVVLGDNASVGIGTNRPKAKLDVRGGSILVGSPGQGIILKSPSGTACTLLAIDDAGALTLARVDCP